MRIRPDSSVDGLARLRPILGRDDPEATITAGNASGQNDGAAICVVTTRANADWLGLRPLVRMVSWGVDGVAPRTMGIGPVPAVASALAAADLKLADINLIELNEAFAAQVLACIREWGFADGDFDRLNVHGSGISLGHPVGATGGRILATLSRETVCCRGARYGLETMCIGGGQGLRVVECASFVAGPTGGLTLAQLGADVIRIDPVGGGSDQHRWPVAADGASYYWASLNKGTRSVAIDLRSPEGRELVVALIAVSGPDAGILIDNVVGRSWMAHDRLAEHPTWSTCGSRPIRTDARPSTTRSTPRWGCRC